MNKPHEIKMSADQIESIIEGQQQQQKSIDQLSVHVLQLKTLIAGNELDKHDRGVIGRIEKVEKNQESFKRFYWMSLGGAVVVGFILQQLWQVIKH